MDKEVTVGVDEFSLVFFSFIRLMMFVTIGKVQLIQ